MGQTTNHGFRYPEGTDEISDGVRPPAFQQLADDIDGVIVTRQLGLASARPAAGTTGRLYWATDTEELSLDIGTGWVVIGPPARGIPPGAMMLYGGAAAPNGWLLCEGQAVSRTTYPGLFAVLGITYGAGDGTATFNLPDHRGRTPVGAGAGSGLTARAVGDKTGAEQVTLTAAQSGLRTHQHSPGSLSALEAGLHAHGITDPGHSHLTAGFVGPVNPSPSFPPGGTGYDLRDGVSTSVAGALRAGNPGGTHWHAIGGATAAVPAADAQQAHTNIQPSLVSNVIVKT